MTVSSETNHSGPYNGNGATTVFDFDFRIVSASHLNVILTSAAGEETSLTVYDDYSVSGVGVDVGGAVTLATAPASGETVTILREVPFTQETDLENQGAYYAETIEQALDLMAMRDQQLQEQVDRSVKVPASYTGADLDLLTASILRMSDSADNIDVVADNVEDVNTVAASAADVALVADHIDAVITASGSALSLAPASFVAAAAQTVFTMPATPISAANVLVWVGGVRQIPSTNYSVSGTSLTLASAPGSGVAVEVLVISAVSFEAVEVLRDEARADAVSAGASAAIASAADISAQNQSAAAASSAAASAANLLALGEALSNVLGAFSVDADGDLVVAYNSTVITNIEINAGSGDLLITYEV